MPKGYWIARVDVTDPEPLPPEHPLWTAPNCFITPHTAGETRRFVVGHPGFQRIDVLAGATLLRLAAAFQQATTHHELAPPL